MMTVGGIFMHVSVRELKNSLSRYLRMVKQGQTLEVTSHRLPVARLSPISEKKETGIRRLMTLEGITWNGEKPRGGRLRPSIIGKTLATRVLEDRR